MDFVVDGIIYKYPKSTNVIYVRNMFDIFDLDYNHEEWCCDFSFEVDENLWLMDGDIFPEEED